MNKLLLFVLGVLIALPAFSQPITINGIKYDILSGTNARVASHNNVSGSISIPNKIRYRGINYTVVSIDKEAFKYCDLTSVEIPNSVTSIGEDAFAYSRLTSVEIPNSVTKIYQGAFTFSHLTSLVIPKSVTWLGDGVFAFCDHLTSVTILGSDITFESDVFLDCENLEKAEFASIEALCGLNFYNPNSNPLSSAYHLYIDGKEVTELIIPETVTKIGNSAFTDCRSLTSVKIPNSVKGIGECAFSGCRSMTAIKIPSGATEIGYQAFSGCRNLTAVYYDTDHPLWAEGEEIFSENTYENATLYVPESAIGTFKSTMPWLFFEKIEPYDFAGIEDIAADDGSEIEYSSQYEVYNLNGQLAGSSVDGLAPGIYIVRQGKAAKKIIVKH